MARSLQPRSLSQESLARSPETGVFNSESSARISQPVTHRQMEMQKCLWSHAGVISLLLEILPAKCQCVWHSMLFATGQHYWSFILHPVQLKNKVVACTFSGYHAIRREFRRVSRFFEHDQNILTGAQLRTSWSVFAKTFFVEAREMSIFCRLFSLPSFFAYLNSDSARQSCCLITRDNDRRSLECTRTSQENQAL